MATSRADKQFPRARIIVAAEPIATMRGRRPGPVETLFAVSKAVSSRSGLGELLQQTTRALVRALGADIGSMWRLDMQDHQLLPVAGYQVPKPLRPMVWSPAMLPTGAFVSAICDGGGAVYSSNSANDPRFQHPLLRLVPHRSVLIQPLRVRGQAIGVFAFIWTRARHRFPDVQLRLVETVTQQTAIAIENAELAVEVGQFSKQLEGLVRTRTSRLMRAYTALRSSREEMRALSAHIEHIREEERTRIAREIHDELGQALTVLRMDLSHVARVRQQPVADPVEDEDTQRLLTTVDGMLTTVRRIACELRPHILDDLGLLAALEWQTAEFEKRTAIRCRFRYTGLPNGVDRERSTALFRIFQEMLTNIARHAEATRVQIRLHISRAFVSLGVRDNGKGIGTVPAGRPQGLGLLGMQERANAFGGRVVIAAAHPRGTSVRVRIPRP